MARRQQFSVGELTVDSIIGAGAPGIKTAGKTLYVDSGREYPNAYPTLATALAQCTSSNGDVIHVVPGHAETLTATLAINKIGVTIIGHGFGNLRPTFTVNAAIPGLNVTAADVTVYNLRVVAGASATTASRLVRVAANRALFIGCQFEIAYKVFHTVVILSGDQVTFKDCNFLNTYAPGAGAAGAKAQSAILNIGGTKALVTGCRFNDTAADKAQRWKTCVEGGKLTASLDIEKCFFLCRGVATATRSAAASGYQATVDCRGISPSSNTAVGSIFTPTYQFIIETYNVAAINKVGVVTVTTSDLRLKTAVVYL